MYAFALNHNSFVMKVSNGKCMTGHKPVSVACVQALVVVLCDFFSSEVC